jgi:hypothetical protein
MAETRTFATYTDLDGTTKRYIDIPEHMISHIDTVGHTVICLIARTPWPVKERAFMAALTMMDQHEIEKVKTFVDELQGSFRYYQEIEERQKRRQSN